MAKPSSFREYIDVVVGVAGSDLAVGKFLGFSDGSRVGTWRKGEGRGSELACIKLARWMGDDPLEILRLAEYTEMADLLDGTAKVAPAQVSALLPQLVASRKALSTVIKAIDTGYNNGRYGSKA